MPITITVEDAKFVLKLISCYQLKHIPIATAIAQKLEKGEEKFELQDLEKHEDAVNAIYRAGYFGERLEELISDAEGSPINRIDEITNN